MTAVVARKRNRGTVIIKKICLFRHQKNSNRFGFDQPMGFARFLVTKSWQLEPTPKPLITN